MKPNQTIILASLAAVLLITTLALYLTPPNNPRTSNEPEAPAPGSLPAVQTEDFTATAYPETLPAESVSGILGSLSAYVENILNPGLTVAAFLETAYQNQILRLNITETGGEAVLVTKQNADAFTGERNPLRATRQIINYAANSGHTINDLTITEEISTAGAKDFFAYLDSATLIAGEDGAPNHYELSEQARGEIIRYCSDILAENRDTELYILSDSVIAFVICERYSEESLLGSFSFLEKTDGGAYRIKTVIDFNC